jgi:hypothetical protein
MERFSDRQVPCVHRECNPAFKGLWYIHSYQPICLELARLKFCKLVRFNRMFVSDDLHYEWVFPVSQFEERCTNRDYILIIFNVFNTSSENWRRTQFLGIVFRDGVFNSHNSRIWSEENPHQIRERDFQQRLINVWAGIIGNRLIGPRATWMERRLTVHGMLKIGWTLI